MQYRLEVVYVETEVGLWRNKEIPCEHKQHNLSKQSPHHLSHTKQCYPFFNFWHINIRFVCLFLEFEDGFSCILSSIINFKVHKLGTTGL